MKIKHFLPLLLLTWQVQAGEKEIADLRQALEKVLPKGWTVENRITSLEVIGPEVRIISPISLPPEPEEVLWRDYSHPLKVHVKIIFQARMPDDDLAELRVLRDHFKELTEKAANRQSKGWSDTIQEYGAVQLPDFQSSTTAVFVKNNTFGQWIRPEETAAVFDLINKELVARFARVSDK